MKTPLTTKYKIIIELNALSKQKTLHSLFKNYLKSILENYEDHHDIIYRWIKNTKRSQIVHNIFNKINII
jgi:hypothetical protein